MTYSTNESNPHGGNCVQILSPCKIAVIFRSCFDRYHSISMVPGGFEVISLNTLETSLTSCIILEATFSMKSGENLKDLAVI